MILFIFVQENEWKISISHCFSLKSSFDTIYFTAFIEATYLGLTIRQSHIDIINLTLFNKTTPNQTKPNPFNVKQAINLLTITTKKFPILLQNACFR
jgi:hypothetical protein